KDLNELAWQTRVKQAAASVDTAAPSVEDTHHLMRKPYSRFRAAKRIFLMTAAFRWDTPLWVTAGAPEAEHCLTVKFSRPFPRCRVHLLNSKWRAKVLNLLRTANQRLREHGLPKKVRPRAKEKYISHTIQSGTASDWRHNDKASCTSERCEGFGETPLASNCCLAAVSTAP